MENKIAHIKLKGCPLCNEILNNSNAFTKMLDTRFEPLLETENFLVINDIAPIIQGHILLVSKKCFSSFSDTPPEMLSELNNIKQRTEEMFAGYHMNSFWFEHGCVSDMNTGASCINHAHLHFFPSEISIDANLKNVVKLHDNTINKYISFPKSLKHITTDYLYYEKIGQNPIIIEIRGLHIFPQFIRYVIAQAHDLNEWNWLSILESQLSSREKV